jgi:2,4-dienoyl-CoA reductase-like NADH-dependent reductase (Old Yellow Enzyme family)
VVKRLVESGLQMLNVTSSSPCLVGELRGGRAIADFEHGDEHPLMTIARQMTLVRALRDHFPGVPMIGSGLSWLRQFLPHFAAGALRSGWMDFAGLGRSALACPDLPARVLRSGVVSADSTCMVCSACAVRSEITDPNRCRVFHQSLQGRARAGRIQGAASRKSASRDDCANKPRVD